MELFLQRARRAQVGFNATPRDYLAIVRICQLAEGIPLAIELAVNVNTVALAYRELDSAGVIATRRGEGTFVASTPGAAEMRRLVGAALQGSGCRVHYDVAPFYIRQVVDISW